MPLEVRRVLARESELLRETRLAALKDAPFAFGSSYADEVRRPYAEWVDRARAGAAGVDRVTFFAVVDARVVGLVGGYRPDPNCSNADVVLALSPVVSAGREHGPVRGRAAGTAFPAR